MRCSSTVVYNEITINVTLSLRRYIPRFIYYRDILKNDKLYFVGWPWRQYSIIVHLHKFRSRDTNRGAEEKSTKTNRTIDNINSNCFMFKNENKKC